LKEPLRDFSRKNDEGDSQIIRGNKIQEGEKDNKMWRK